MIKFRLRTLLIVVTLLSVVAAIVAWRIHQNRMRLRAIETIKAKGGKLVRDDKSQAVLRVYLTGKSIDDDLFGELAAWMKYLPDLNELDLVRTTTTDASIEPLSQLDQLSEIYLFETLMTETGIEDLRQRLPEVAVKIEEPEPIASGMMAMKIYRHAITALAASPITQHVATGNGAGMVHVWNLEQSRAVASWQAHQEWVFDIDYAPDGKTIATGGDRVVKLWNSSDKSLIHQFVGPKNDVHDVAFTPDGQLLIAASDDRKIRIWDVQSQQLVQTLIGHRRQIPRIALNPEGDLLASVSRDKTVRLWSIPDGNPIATLTGHRTDVMAVAFDSAGKRIATGDQNGIVRVWQTDSQQLIDQFTSRLGGIFDLAFDPRSNTLSASGRQGLQSWNLDTSNNTEFTNDQRFISRLHYCPPQGTLLTTNISGELRMLDERSHQTLRTWQSMYGRRGLELADE